MATPRKSAPRSHNKPPSSRPKPGFRLTRARIIGLGTAVVVILLGVYVAAGLRTVSDYRARLASGSFNFAGSFTFTGQDFLSPMDSNMNFNGTYSAPAGQKPSASALFFGNWASRDYSGEGRLSSGRLFFSLSGPVMPVIRYRQGPDLLPLQSGRWYSAQADESLYDNVCAHTQSASLQGKLELYSTIKSLQLMPSPWINFWSGLQNLSATHLTATLSGDQLAKLWDAAQKAAPPGCSDPNTLGITSDDLKHVTTRVDLLAAHDGNADQLTVTLSDKTLGASAGLKFLTSSYGQATPAPPPGNAVDINAAYAHFARP